MNCLDQNRGYMKWVVGFGAAVMTVGSIVANLIAREKAAQAPPSAINFSHQRGFYDAPFELRLTARDPTAAIRYTTDGTPPSALTGLVYTNPIPIKQTSIIRAAAIAPGANSIRATTHTYIFPADVIAQSSDGLP